MPPCKPHLRLHGHDDLRRLWSDDENGHASAKRYGDSGELRRGKTNLSSASPIRLAISNVGFTVDDTTGDDRTFFKSKMCHGDLAVERCSEVKFQTSFPFNSPSSNHPQDRNNELSQNCVSALSSQVPCVGLLSIGTGTPCGLAISISGQGKNEFAECFAKTVHSGKAQSNTSPIVDAIDVSNIPTHGAIDSIFHRFQFSAACLLFDLGLNLACQSSWYANSLEFTGLFALHQALHLERTWCLLSS